MQGEFLKIALEFVGPPWWGLCACKEALNGEGIAC